MPDPEIIAVTMPAADWRGIVVVLDATACGDRPGASMQRLGALLSQRIACAGGVAPEAEEVPQP